MKISEAGFFFDGGLRNVGDSGLSGKWVEVLLWRLYDCLYELLFIRVDSISVYIREFSFFIKCVDDCWMYWCIANNNCYGSVMSK